MTKINFIGFLFLLLSASMFAQNTVTLKGKIIEEGTHNELSKKQGAYFELVKNQLELGD